MMIHMMVVMQCSIEYEANRISLEKHLFIRVTEQFFRRSFQCPHGRGVDGCDLAVAINGEYARRDTLKNISRETFDFFESPSRVVLMQKGDERRHSDGAD